MRWGVGLKGGHAHDCQLGRPRWFDLLASLRWMVLASVCARLRIESLERGSAGLAARLGGTEEPEDVRLDVDQAASLEAACLGGRGGAQVALRQFVVSMQVTRSIYVYT